MIVQDQVINQHHTWGKANTKRFSLKDFKTNLKFKADLPSKSKTILIK